MRRLTFTPLPIRLATAAVLCALAATAAVVRGAVPGNAEEDVRRLLTLLAAVGEEYREGVHDGTVVRPIEFEEAKTFLEDAQQRFQRLATDLPNGEPSGPLFAEIAAAIDGKAPAESVAEQLTTLRQRVVALTGISEQVYPPAPPAAARGKLLFDQYCVTCHGERGDGKGPSAAALSPAPANFTDAQFMHSETPYDFYHVISLGKSNTAMPAWDGVLSVQDRWDLVSYLWTLPLDAAGVAEGQGVYLAHCASCHGSSGDGRGVFAEVLVKPAPDLTQPQTLARQADAELFAATTGGIAGTPMPSFARTLPDDERWKAVAFVRLLSLGGPVPPSANTPNGGGSDAKRFAGLLRLLAHTYEQVWTRNDLTNAIEYGAAVAVAENATAGAEAIAQDMQARAPAEAAKVRELTAAIALQVRQHAPVATVAAAVDDLTALVESDSAVNTAPGPGASPPSAVDTALAESRRLLDAAVAAYGRAEPGAVGLAADAYLEFEPLEQRLGATAPGLKARVEERFLTLRSLLRSAGNGAEVQAVATAIDDDFTAVHAALQPQTTPYALFIESATIILREGFEIVLVIGALIAYVVKTGNPAMRRSVYGGTVLGVAASLVTAFIMGELLRLHPSSSDMLEGFTMLLAAVVLFWVSYWLISKAEADKWQQYIRGKVQSALSGGRGVALAGAAFLAVYREGFETVLFYQALYASAPAASMTVTAGFIAGSVALLVVYALFRWFEVQIPIRQFFFVTGLLLYVMATIFAGQGVHELQEAGLIAMTPVAWIPAIPLLGIYPSVQSLAVQAVFIGLLLYATVVTLRRARQATAGEQAAGTVTELRALATAINAVRQEIEGLRRSESVPPLAALGDRLEGLLVRVEELAGQVRLKGPGTLRTNGGGRRNGH